MIFCKIILYESRSHRTMDRESSKTRPRYEEVKKMLFFVIPCLTWNPLFSRSYGLRLPLKNLEDSMTIKVKSKIENGWIRVTKKVHLKNGTQVIVRIGPILKIKEKQDIILAH